MMNWNVHLARLVMMLGHGFLPLEAGGKRTSLCMSEHAFSTSEVLSIGRGENNIICTPQLKLAFEQNGKCSLGKIGTVSKVFQKGCVVASLGNVVLKPVPSYRPAIAIRPTGNCHSVYRQLPFGLLAIAVRWFWTALVTILSKGRMETDRLKCFKNSEIFSL